MSAATTPGRARTSATPDVRRTGVRRERRHLHPISEQPRRHPLVFILLYVLLGIGGVMGAVSLNALAARDAVELAALEQEVATAERSYGQLIAEVAALEDPARIQQMAEQMGMQRVQPRHLVAEQTLPTDVTIASTDDPVKPVLSADR